MFLLSRCRIVGSLYVLQYRYNVEWGNIALASIEANPSFFASMIIVTLISLFPSVLLVPLTIDNGYSHN